MKNVVAAMAVLALAACATAPAAPSGPPSLHIAAGQPAPPQARFYASCISEAAAANTYDREANVLRFRCEGATARGFFEALGPWSAQVGSEISADGRVWRFSTPIRDNPSFVDFCWREGETHGCTVVLNVGEFLDYRQ